MIALLLALATTPALAASPTQADCDVAAPHTVLVPATSQAKDARAIWLDAETLRWSPGREGVLQLRSDSKPPIALLPERDHFRVPPGTDVRALLRTDLTIEHVAPDGRILDRTHIQSAAALDALYADAAQHDIFGTRDRDNIDATTVAVWAPTARNVALCRYATPRGKSYALVPMQRDDTTGTWRAALPAEPAPRDDYLYLVDVDVPGVGLVRNRVTDPYSDALSADGRRTRIVGDDPAALPADWRTAVPRFPRAARTDTIYELHVRDFSRDDASVPEADRGKYLAFTHPDANGMKHLRALAKAGVTDVHLLPVFDFANVPERGCDPKGDAKHDCFNWGYEPVHFDVPEGSYASDPDGVVRNHEFRRMVLALHDAGLRVGMDVVYNHTTSSGLAATSVLDRIVPGYYHRLDASGAVANSTCCANTATEHRMMAKLMRDSVVHWATTYGIDSFRFDLMGHQPRAAMEDLQRTLKHATGRDDIALIGEGWNFGEVADGKRFVQASQLSLFGAGIGTFSDRARDAVRGGGPGDHGQALVDAKGWISGLSDPAQLAHAADLIRVGLAGTLRDARFVMADGQPRRLADVDYHGQPAGYTASPDEVVNYVENHDNQTLFDLLAFKLPRDTPTRERARVQLLAAATVAFSQGTAYWHAGIDVLRSKSLDRNSYDSGDAFNRLDWSYRDNGFGVGLPPGDNVQDHALMRPLLADAARIKPRPEDIAWMRDAFRDLLRIRASSDLFHLRTAADVQARLSFPHVDGAQDVIVGRLDDRVQYFLNAATTARTVGLSQSRGEAWVLHPVHRSPDAADKRAVESRFDAATGTFTIPPRTAAVFVRPGNDLLPDLVRATLPARLDATPEDITFDVQRPPGYDTTKRYPVLYLDDGQDLADVDVRQTLERLYRARSIPPLIVVAIHMPRDRLAAYGLADRKAGRSIVSHTKYGDVGANAHAYSEWIANTLVPHIDAHYRTDGHRAMLGWSLGGIHAFSMGWNYPELFDRVGAFSPSFWLPVDQKAPQAVRIAQALVDAGTPPKGLRAYFAPGLEEEKDDRDGDGVIDVVDDAQDLAAALRAKGATVDVVPMARGQHRQHTWAAMLPGFLAWAF